MSALSGRMSVMKHYQKKEGISYQEQYYGDFKTINEKIREEND